MFEVKFHQGLLLKKAIDAIKELFPLTLWDCSHEGIAVRSTDLTNNCFVQFRLGRDAFQEFRCDRRFTIGVDLKEFGKIMRYVTVDDIVSLLCLEMSDQIKVVVEPIAESEATEYLCRLKGLDFDWNELRHESNDAIIKMSSAKLQRICRNLSVFGKTINIVCKPTEKQVLFFTRGEIGNGCAHIFPSLCTDDPNSETTIEIKIAISVSFSLKNLTQITKASSVSPQVILRLYGEGLLELEYNVKTMNTELKSNPNLPTIASIHYSLASVVEE